MSSESRYRPYAPPANVVKLLQRLRSVNIPEVIDSDYLAALGFSRAIASRVLGAMRFLGLIKESGEPEEALRSLARSTDEEYKQLLEGIVEEAYRDVFQVAHPSQHRHDEIVNAFRRFEPASQHERMAILFLGLCREAGMSIIDAPRQREVQKARERTTRQPRDKGARQGRQTQLGDAPACASPILWGYFQRLPKPRSVFPQDQQDAWLAAVKSAFGLEYRIEETGSNERAEHGSGE